jgi:hypothetical protein
LNVIFCIVLGYGFGPRGVLVGWGVALVLGSYPILSSFMREEHLQWIDMKIFRSHANIIGLVVMVACIPLAVFLPGNPWLFLALGILCASSYLVLASMHTVLRGMTRQLRAA